MTGDALLAAWERPAPPVPDREAMWPELSDPLTAREFDVLDLLARHFSSREIMTTLALPWQAVAQHTANIYQKLAVTNREAAVRRAWELHILAAESV